MDRLKRALGSPEHASIFMIIAWVGTVAVGLDVLGLMDFNYKYAFTAALVGYWGLVALEFSHDRSGN
jgi:hypothetical protein